MRVVGRHKALSSCRNHTWQTMIRFRVRVRVRVRVKLRVRVKVRVIVIIHGVLSIGFRHHFSVSRYFIIEARFLSLILSLSHSLSLSFSLSLILILSLSLSHCHSLSHSLSLSLNPTRITNHKVTSIMPIRNYTRISYVAVWCF